MSSDAELLCNFKKCRKRIAQHAWVTSCFHVFCEDHGQREFTNQSQIQCPACNHILPRQYDVIKTDLNPSENFKAMVLAGMRPEIIMDIATRATAFWSYQVHLEHIYQQNSVKTYRERLSQLEISYEALVVKIKSEMTGLKRQIEASKKDLDIQMKRAEDLAEKLMEKTTQCHKLQAMYDTLRRSTISSTMMEQNRQANMSPCVSYHTLGPRTLKDVMLPPAGCHNRDPLDGRRTPEPSQNQGFNFRPVTPNASTSRTNTCLTPRSSRYINQQ